LFWDFDARNHEVTLLKIKHIRLREQYGEGEVPHEAKTGGDHHDSHWMNYVLQIRLLSSECLYFLIQP
jgi:hypothetical protein